MTAQFDSIDYLYEKFSMGLDILATHPGPIKERLIDAYSSQVTRADRPSPNLDHELTRRINEIHNKFHIDGHAGITGQITMAVDGMTEAEVASAAHQIFGITQDLAELDARP